MFAKFKIPLLFIITLFHASLQAAPDIVLTTATGAPGSSVNIDVNFTNTVLGNPNDVVGLQFDLLFDTTKLTATIPANVTSASIVGGVRLIVQPVLAQPIPPIPTGKVTTISFTINGGAADGIEVLTVSSIVLGNANGGNIVIDGTTNGSITIATPAPGTISFNPIAVSTNESVATTTVSLERTGGTTGAVSVTVNTANGTAVAGGDYTAIANQVVSWTDGESGAKSVTTNIVNDNVIEADEIFTFTASNVTGGAAIGAATATVTIVNDDVAPGSISFNPVLLNVTEGTATITATLERTGGSDGAVSVTVNSSDGTASAGTDYTAIVNQVINWADGDSAAKKVVVSITDDAAVESNEIFTLTVGTATGGVTLGLVSAIIAIVDNDNPGIITIQSIDVNETAGTVIVTLTRTGGSNGAVSVEAFTSDGSAIAGLDYTALTQTVSWADGDIANKTITITILDDTLAEFKENFNIGLRNATGGVAVSAANGVANIGINSNEIPPSQPVPTLSFWFMLLMAFFIMFSVMLHTRKYQS